MKYSLPESAKDLLIKDGRYLMRSVTLYEILKRFSHIIRLTPFRYEDFSAALTAEDQSPLLAEIHIQLLKTLIREDRQQQTWLGPPDIRDSVNIYLQLADHITWPAALRIYLSADAIANSPILDQLSKESKSYPLDVTVEVKLSILEHLCDQFLLSNLARDVIANGNNSIVKHDTTCRSCSKPNGPVLSCSNCPAVYHLSCSDPTSDGQASDDEPYLCVICRSNHIKGVSDCLSDEEKSGNLKRHEAIGVDKQGNRYWTVIRRVFVIDENEDDVRYYTEAEQLDQLIDSLKDSRNDKQLIACLEEQRPEIKRQMLITKDLYNNLPDDFKNEDGTYSKYLGQDGAHKNYVNHFSNTSLSNKNQNPERDVNRSLANKFCMNVASSFKWHGAMDGHSFAISATVKSSIFKFEASLPQTFVHPCWSTHRSQWMRRVNYAQDPKDYAVALSVLETCIKPVLFKSAWYESVGFTQLFRSTFAEREEMKKTERQPRGFERREWFVQDIELSYKLGTVVKFSPKLKPVKHQVWKQKGEEYRITGLNGWFWRSRNQRSRSKPKSKPASYDWTVLHKTQPQATIRRCIIAQPKLPPVHDFLTKRTKISSILVLTDSELRRLARSGGFKEARSFSYSAKQNNHVWPYSMTPRPTFRTCWLFRNRCINTMQDVAIQMRVLHASLRWDELQARPPASGHNVIVTDESTVTIQLLKKRDRLPYLTHSEYLIKKTITPIEQPKYRKVNLKASIPSARSGLRVRRQTEDEKPKRPTSEELWVSENQLELWELKQFDEKVERQKQLLRERAIREENEKRRKLEEEKRRNAELERRRRQQQEEEQKKARMSSNNSDSSSTPTTPQTSRPINIINLNTTQQPRPASTMPVLRYFRTEQGQIIRLPASYLQRGTPLILRHVGPGSNQTNTYIIRATSTVGVSSPAASTTEAAPTSLPGSTAEGTNIKAETSVGTSENELAHDQHAPNVNSSAKSDLKVEPQPAE